MRFFRKKKQRKSKSKRFLQKIIVMLKKRITNTYCNTLFTKKQICNKRINLCFFKKNILHKINEVLVMYQVHFVCFLS